MISCVNSSYLWLHQDFERRHACIQVLQWLCLLAISAQFQPETTIKSAIILTVNNQQLTYRTIVYIWCIERSSTTSLARLQCIHTHTHMIRNMSHHQVCCVCRYVCIYYYYYQYQATKCYNIVSNTGFPTGFSKCLLCNVNSAEDNKLLH